MHDTTAVQLDELVKLRHEQPSEIIAEAVKIGLSKLYMDCILQKYLNKKISRNKAISAIGLDNIKLAEQQQEIVQKDIAWGLKHG